MRAHIPQPYGRCHSLRGRGGRPEHGVRPAAVVSGPRDALGRGGRAPAGALQVILQEFRVQSEAARGLVVAAVAAAAA
eukprot:CAMPEP_0194596928 /NCGR_PEP_ID=MMETSP0292-20121207/25980_1 /TAXON_ID=39354 /ORGANISM="Heterosigma akashiwo, Strain CCMP2393" /LENGTH=77 /DNA_ID=CAMNT_0039457341 /DNA_START=21 /DNA_END=251 /DNA_ORIENTATION=-